MRDCPRCGRELPDDASSCDCETAPEHGEEIVKEGDPTSPESGLIPRDDADEEESEEEIIDDEDEFAENEEPVDDFDSLPRGPIEEISFDDEVLEQSAPVPEPQSPAMRILLIAIGVLLPILIGLAVVLYFVSSARTE